MSFSRLLWWRPPCLLRVVIVNLQSTNVAIRGVLWGSRGEWLTLRDAALLNASVAPTTVDGEVVVHRSNVAFIQVLP